MRRALIIRHLAFEDLGAWSPVLQRQGFALDWHEAGVDPLSRWAPTEHDLLIVLGGPIGIYELDLYPWLAEELAFIAARVRGQFPTIGVCLGAQAIASALGARVYPTGKKEIGFAPLSLTHAGTASCLAPFTDDPITLHWHGDTFDLPAGAQLLASTPQTPHQAFALGPKVLGVQFHPEAGGPGFERWLIGHACELAAAGVSIPALRADAARHGPALAAKAERVLQRFLEGALL
jgi:GMP synthase (glutamine-hydrolysing)